MGIQLCSSSSSSSEEKQPRLLSGVQVKFADYPALMLLVYEHSTRSRFGQLYDQTTVEFPSGVKIGTEKCFMHFRLRMEGRLRL